MRLSQIASALGLLLEGDGALLITGLAGLHDAGPNDLAFIAEARYLRDLRESRAGAVLAPLDLEVGRPCLRTHQPYADFARAIELLLPRAPESPGVHPTAVVEAGVELGSGVWIGAYTVVRAGSRIGDRSRIHPHVTIYPGVSIGSDCVIHSGAHLREGARLGDRVVVQNGAVLGSDGFGFTTGVDGTRLRVPHRSGVWVGSDVEIGANTTIDASHPGHPRHAEGSSSTRIADAVIIDNQVQIGHGCAVGEGSVLCAQVGLAGSTIVGRGVFMAGQAGAKGHITIGDGSRIFAATGVTGNVAPGGQILGLPPGMDRRLWARIVASWKRLPDLFVRVRRLEAALGVRAEPEPRAARAQSGSTGSADDL
jgi:UDP-3-O-[3-hydroxymyristoyl] glucosamine N-acyltransferase